MATKDTSRDASKDSDDQEQIVTTKTILMKATKKKTPPVLKIEKTSENGEKSPKPRTVLELFKRYNSKKEKPTENVKQEEKIEAKGNVNVGFDEMSSDEKNGFLKKLQMLTIDSCEKPELPTPGASTSSSQHRKNRRDSSNRRYSHKKAMENERYQQGKKPSARRLNFNDHSDENQASQQKNTFVAAMTREYEKIVGKNDCHPLPINKLNHRHSGPLGSLETPTDSPIKSSRTSTPDDVFSPLRDRYSSINDDAFSPRKKFVPRNIAHREQQNPNATWHGELPPRDYTSPTFSRKIFVGGVPWDITESALKESFGEFGACAVEWPGQEARYRVGQNGQLNSSTIRAQSKYSGQAATGYVYMIFDDERAVASLLHECSQEIGGAGEWYFKIRAQRSKSTEIRQVQIIPWVTCDSLHCEDESILQIGIEPKRTVFVGALHGMMTAQVLHSIMEDCFGSVECVQLDTDKFKYPIGSGRVTFREHNAYFKAIEIGYLFVHTSKFKKRVQIDPFLESTSCMVCNDQPAHCFCRNRNCFKYYCNKCWAMDHCKEREDDVHIPVIVPSSASKPYQPPRRSTSMHANSSAITSTSTSMSMSAPNNSQNYGQLLSPVSLMVAPPVQTLSSLYGFSQNGGSVQQHHIPTSHPPLMQQHAYDGSSTPMSQCETDLNGRKISMGSMSGIPNGTFFVNSTPMMTPQKGNCGDGYYSSPAVAPTTYVSPHAYYTASPINNCSTNASPYYGGNMYYGFMSPQQTTTITNNGHYMYDGNANARSTYVCSPQSQNYQ